MLYTCTRHSITSEHLAALTFKWTISVNTFRIVTTRKWITVTFIYIYKKYLYNNYTYVVETHNTFWPVINILGCNKINYIASCEGKSFTEEKSSRYNNINVMSSDPSGSYPNLSFKTMHIMCNLQELIYFPQILMNVIWTVALMYPAWTPLVATTAPVRLELSFKMRA